LFDIKKAALELALTDLIYAPIRREFIAER
jgi:hypothetical protein